MKTDQQIRHDVIEELGWEPHLNATGLDINVQNGIVRISGKVDSFAKLALVHKTAERLKGVKEVITDLRVVLPDADFIPDNIILENISNALKWHSSIPTGRIKINVDNGLVTLEGDVDWNYQKIAVLKTVRNLKGVTGITDLISITPQSDASLIAENIRKALERRADLEAANIKIETVGDKVILKGTAHSWNERKEAAHAVWASPGVSEVDDQIVIEYD
jgi:osmotically-inducible protein OsmY